MSKKAITAGQDAKGNWHIIDGPEVPYQIQKKNIKDLVGKHGKIKDGKQVVQLDKWGLYIQTTKRFRRPRVKALADPQVSARVQV